MTLGALVVFAVANLIEFHTPKHLWRTDKLDFGVYLIALLATVGLGIEEGLMVGAGISLMRIIKLASIPHTALLGPMVRAASVEGHCSPGAFHALRPPSVSFPLAERWQDMAQCEALQGSKCQSTKGHPGASL